MQLFHIVSQSSVDSVLREGLKRGSKGLHSQDKHAALTNDYLDKVCPKHLKARGLSRNNCLYLYLALEGKIHDIKDGKVHPLQAWLAKVKAPKIALAVTIDPVCAYVSDLDAYDALAEALTTGASDAKCRRLATTYWQRIISLQDVVKYYYWSERGGLQIRENAPSRLPSKITRVEVMITRSVVASKLTAILN